jgi:hypothetical protein
VVCVFAFVAFAFFWSGAFFFFVSVHFDQGYRYHCYI